MTEKKLKIRKKATTEEGREQQLINLAIDAAERLLSSSNPPASVIVHYLKLATEKAKSEARQLKAQTTLTEAKAKQIQTSMDNEILVEKAIEALKSYRSSDE